MAEFRFQPDPDFELVVTGAAMGTDKFGRETAGAQSRVRASRRRRTTLINVGEQIIEEAKNLVDRELPGTNAAGGRNTGYDFGRADAGGKTYRASFKMRVEREGGRLVLIVENTHPHARDVEFGNDPSGQVRSVRRKRGYFTIPLSVAGAARSRIRAASPEARQRARARAQVSYYKKRQAHLGDREKAIQTRTRELMKRQQVRGVTSSLLKDASELKRSIDRQKRGSQRATANYAKARAMLGKPRTSAFVKVNPETGRVSLYTKTFRTYKGYAILRQATRRVTVRTLE